MFYHSLYITVPAGLLATPLKAAVVGSMAVAPLTYGSKARFLKICEVGARHVSVLKKKQSMSDGGAQHEEVFFCFSPVRMWSAEMCVFPEIAHCSWLRRVHFSWGEKSIRSI